MTRNPKGSVVVYEADGRLRLRWSGKDIQGRSKRYGFAFGYANATNRIAAQKLACEIELDIASGNFDYSLRKYKRYLEKSDLTLEDLLNRFIKNQIDPTQSSSTERYKTLRVHLIKHLGNMAVEDLAEKHAQKLIDAWMQKTLKGKTINIGSPFWQRSTFPTALPTIRGTPDGARS